MSEMMLPGEVSDAAILACLRVVEPGYETNSFSSLCHASEWLLWKQTPRFRQTPLAWFFALCYVRPFYIFALSMSVI
jgi:hypothetical protein